MSEFIKNCPFCNSNEIMVVNEKEDVFFCRCRDCKAKTAKAVIRSYAIDYWNTRQGQPDTQMEQWEQKARAVLNLLKEEYKYIAMDDLDDRWTAYKEKPFIDDRYGNNYWESFGGSYELYAFDLDPAPDWKTSLIERSE